MTRITARLLLVEDEQDIRSLMALHLKREGYEVDEAANGEEALRKIHEASHSLYVFDWMLPGMNGIELARSVRGGRSAAPILMVTAKADPADIVLGLESGADDYVTKPFEVPVFLARVRALLRRAGAAPVGGGADPAAGDEPAELSVGDLVIRPGSYEVFCSGVPVQCTLSEFKLLHALLRSQGKVLTRNQLIDQVQGEGVSVVDRTVDTHVFGLRKKLGAFGELIETVRGVGYRVKPHG